MRYSKICKLLICARIEVGNNNRYRCRNGTDCMVVNAIGRKHEQRCNLHNPSSCVLHDYMSLPYLLSANGCWGHHFRVGHQAANDIPTEVRSNLGSDECCHISLAAFRIRPSTRMPVVARQLKDQHRNRRGGPPPSPLFPLSNLDQESHCHCHTIQRVDTTAPPTQIHHHFPLL